MGKLFERKNYLRGETNCNSRPPQRGTLGTPPGDSYSSLNLKFIIMERIEFHITELKVSTKGNTYLQGKVIIDGMYSYGKVMTVSNDSFTVGQVVKVPLSMVIL